MSPAAATMLSSSTAAQVIAVLVLAVVRPDLVVGVGEFSIVVGGELVGQQVVLQAVLIYAMAFGMLDTNTPLKDQSYDDTQTWDDYFKSAAVETKRTPRVP